ncbi:MAG: hypothetical protein JWM74_1159 [Myxococcaceae bacterium]|nr:hypothetical protein [Myxococcaceae bacterium]
MTTLRAMMVACGFGLSVWVSSPRVARAEPTQADLQMARDLFGKAEKDEEAKDWSAALEKLRRAYAVKSTAGLRFHIAVCEENLGQLVDALHDYEAAEELAKADKTEKGKQVLAVIAEPLLAIRARVPHLKLTLPADVTDGEITLDGKKLPKEEAANAVALEPGPHRVEASAPGRTPFATTMTLKEREVTSLEIKLPPIAVAAPVAPTPAGGAGTGNAVMPPDEARKTRSRTGAILVTGGAVVLAVGGLGAFLLADSAQGDARAECARTGACDGAKSTVRVWDTVALGAWIGAAAAAGYAIILWSKPSHDDHAASPARVRVGAGSLHLEGSF